MPTSCWSGNFKVHKKRPTAAAKASGDERWRSQVSVLRHSTWWHSSWTVQEWSTAMHQDPWHLQRQLSLGSAKWTTPTVLPQQEQCPVDESAVTVTHWLLQRNRPKKSVSLMTCGDMWLCCLCCFRIQTGQLQLRVSVQHRQAIWTELYIRGHFWGEKLRIYEPHCHC